MRPERGVGFAIEVLRIKSLLEKGGKREKSIYEVDVTNII